MKDFYNEIEIDSEVMEASPHRLVQLMYEKCIDGIQISRHLMRENDVPKKCRAITKVIDIVNYLKISLNMEAEEAKELSQHLHNVYSYIEHQLSLANLKNETIYLDNALSKLQKIKESWDKIGTTHGQ
jgi:flagellar protein FliS